MTSNLKSFIGEDYDEKNAKNILTEIQKTGLDVHLSSCYQLITSLRNFSEQYCYLRSCIVGIFHALKYSNLSNEKKEINILINAMYEIDHYVSDFKKANTDVKEDEESKINFEEGKTEQFENKFKIIIISERSSITNQLHMKYFIDYARVIFVLNGSTNLRESYFDDLLNKVEKMHISPKNEKKTVSKI